MAIKNTQRGFTLLIAVIFMSVMLSFGLALGSLAYKQQVLASGAVESQYAFYAADAALECALYADQQLNFFNPDGGAIGGGMFLACDSGSFQINSSTPPLGSTHIVSTAQLNLDNTRCANITVYKPLTTGTTYIFSQGYNVSCDTVNSNNSSGARMVSRGINAHY